MKKRIKMYLMVIALVLSITSCTTRLVDFTVISTKNAEMRIDKTKGVQTEGKASYFLGMGLNLKDALDNAFEKAGPKYDLLIDGVVTIQNLPFVSIIRVKGIAVSTSDLKASLGTEGFEEWCKTNNVFNPDTANIPN
ncbi:MAG: hypothetical protein GQ534_09390 [Candidatus Delongbacteria bacterium]|nr:hypothetical protein [Candidatus Delongbacteria bacterium]